jgi:agmatinase
MNKEQAMTTAAYPGFLESEIPSASFEEAYIHIIPVEMEKSVSYGQGTAKGPRAILEASQQLEAFDGKDIPGRRGIYTHPPVRCRAEKTEEDIAAISKTVAGVLQNKAIPVIIGGEHTVTLGSLQAFKESEEKIGVVQFDAHADLRDTYEGNPLSHACVIRRVHDMGYKIIQMGVRSLSLDEHVFRKAKNIPHIDAETINKTGVPIEILPPGFPRNIYITFDVDCFDPSIMPATGTPEPGGMTWYQVNEALKRIATGRKICGADVVELAPIEGMIAADFTAAKLVYTLAGIINNN